MAHRNRWLLGLAVGAALTYAAMWIGFSQHWGWLAAVDTGLLRTSHDLGAGRPGWVLFWVVFCEIFSPTGFRVMALVGVIAALVRRRLQTALFLVISIGLMGFVTESAKWLADRPRPVTALTHGFSTSFPSGHAVGVMVGVLSLLTVAWPVLSGTRRKAAVAVGAVLVFLVGLGRVVLNVHYPSDVVAGWALGFLFYLLCVRLVPPRPFTSAVGRPAELDTVR